MIIPHYLSSLWAGIPLPIYPRGCFGCFFLSLCLLFLARCEPELHGLAGVVIGREDEMRLEAPAVWEHGGWAVQGLQPPLGTQGRQIRRTSLTCRDATSYKSRIKRFNS